MAPDDTHPAVLELQIEGWRRMSPAEELRRVADLNAGVRQLAAARIRRDRPGITDAELDLELARLWLPPELFRIAREHAEARAGD